MTNIFITTYKKVFELIPRSFKSRLIGVQFVIFIASLADLLGLALFIPLISLITDQKALHGDGIIAELKTYSQIESDSHFLFAIFAFVFVFFVFRGAVIVWCNWFQNKFVFDLSEYIGVKTYNFYLHSSFEDFYKKNSAEIVRELTINPQHFARFLVMPLLTLTTELLVILFILIGIAIYNIEVLVMLLITVFPVAYLFNRLIKKRMRYYGEQQNKLTPILYAQSNRGMFGYIDVKLRHKEQTLLDDYKNVMIKLNEIGLVTSVLGIMPAKLFEIITVLGLILLFSYSMFLTNDPTMVVSLIVIYAASGYRIIPSLSRIVPSFMQLEQYQYLFGVFSKPLGKEVTILNQHETIEFNKSIGLHNISFGFQSSGNKVLDGLNFEVKKGQIIGIIGRSGSGKTTLVQLITGFLQQSEGEILIDGKLLRNENRVSWMNKISYVQQSPYLEDGSLAKNVAFLDEQIDDGRLKRALNTASLANFINGRNPNDIHIAEGGKNLSGGQKQRIIIARALYHYAELIILDEATSALDNETEEVISETVANLKGSGVTIMIIAHRMTSLRAVDRIVEVDNGNIIEKEKSIIKGV